MPIHASLRRVAPRSMITLFVPATRAIGGSVTVSPVCPAGVGLMSNSWWTIRMPCAPATSEWCPGSTSACVYSSGSMSSPSIFTFVSGGGVPSNVMLTRRDLAERIAGDRRRPAVIGQVGSRRRALRLREPVDRGLVLAELLVAEAEVQHHARRIGIELDRLDRTWRTRQRDRCRAACGLRRTACRLRWLSCAIAVKLPSTEGERDPGASHLPHYIS